MSVFLQELADRGVAAAKEPVAVANRARERRLVKMEAALLRADGYKLAEIAHWQGVSRQMAAVRSVQGAPHVLATLRSVESIRR